MIKIANPASNAATDTLSFAETVRARRSWRGYLPDPVPEALIHQVLEEAQLAPSNCNTQPWNVHLVSGATRDRLSQALQQASNRHQRSEDFSWDESAFQGALGDRRHEHGAVYYGNLGIDRGDSIGRARAGNDNYAFYGAPHVALLFMPQVGDSVRVAGDLGMYGQTLLLSLAAHGLGGIPQTVIGLYADTVRETLGIGDDLKLLYAISFGYPDKHAPGNKNRVGRDPIENNVRFYD